MFWGFAVRGVGFGVLQFLVSGSRFRVSGFHGSGFPVRGFRGSAFRVFEIRGFAVCGVGFGVLRFFFSILGFAIRVPPLGFEVLSSGYGVCEVRRSGF